MSTSDVPTGIRFSDYAERSSVFTNYAFSTAGAVKAAIAALQHGLDGVADHFAGAQNPDLAYMSVVNSKTEQLDQVRLFAKRLTGAAARHKWSQLDIHFENTREFFNYVALSIVPPKLAELDKLIKSIRAWAEMMRSAAELIDAAADRLEPALLSNSNGFGCSYKQFIAAAARPGEKPSDTMKSLLECATQLTSDTERSAAAATKAPDVYELVKLRKTQHEQLIEELFYDTSVKGADILQLSQLLKVRKYSSLINIRRELLANLKSQAVEALTSMPVDELAESNFITSNLPARLIKVVEDQIEAVRAAYCESAFNRLEADDIGALRTYINEYVKFAVGIRMGISDVDKPRVQSRVLTGLDDDIRDMLTSIVQDELAASSDTRKALQRKIDAFTLAQAG